MATSSLLQYIKEHELSQFCLIHSLQSTNCTSDNEGDGGRHNLSASLFESPLPQKPTAILPTIIGVTPINNVATPLTLQVDSVERVWSPTMATPSSKRSVSSNIELITSWDQSVSVEERKEEKVKERLRRHGSPDVIVRRLFHSQPNKTTPTKQNADNSYHDNNDENNDRSLPSPAHNNTPTLISDGCGQLEGCGLKTNTNNYSLLSTPVESCTDNNMILQKGGVSADHTPSQAPPTSSLCLDVLFMSNSQLDAVESKNHTPNSALIDHTPNFTPNDHTHNNVNSTHNIEDIPSNDHITNTCISNEVLQEVGVVNSTKDLQFIYPSNTQVLQSLSPPTKRPHPPDVTSLNKKCKQIHTSITIPTSLINKSSEVAILKPDIKTTPTLVSGFQTPLSRPKGSYKIPRSKNTVNEREEKELCDKILQTFKPSLTSTPSLTNNNKNNIPQSDPLGKIPSIQERGQTYNIHEGDSLINQKSDGHLQEGIQNKLLLQQELDSVKQGEHLSHQEEVLSCFKTGSGKELILSKGALEKACELVNEAESCDDNEVGGVKSCNGKLSETSVHERDVSNNGCGHEESEGWSLPADMDWEEFSHFTQLPNKGDDPSLITTNESHVTTPPSPPTHLIGFTMASGRSIPISENSLKIAHKLLQDCNNEGSLLTTPTNHLATPTNHLISPTKQLTTSALTTPTLGFSTASNKPIHVTNDSLIKARSILATPPKDTPIPQFTTASGRGVVISKESLDAVKGLFDNEQLDSPTKSSPITSIAQTPPTKHNTTSPTGKDTSLISENNSIIISTTVPTNYNTPLLINEAPPTNYSLGFTTASGKGVAISKESLQAVKNIFSDDNLNNFIPDSKTPLTINKTTPTINEAPPTSLIGFTTASGKGVPISENSLQPVKKLFNDDSPVAMETNSAIAMETIPVTTHSFTTASGKGVAISEDSLQAIKKLFNDDLPVAMETNSAVAMETNNSVAMETRPNMTNSFTTASGRGVAISKEALDSVRSLLTTPPRNEKENEIKNTKATPLAPPTSELIKRRSIKKRGRVSKPDSLLYDRSDSLNAKISRCTSEEATPLTTPTHIKFQKGGGVSVTNSNKRNNPLWKGNLSTTTRPQTTPPSSPLNLTSSQLTSLTTTSPLSPGTLNSSRLNIDDSGILIKAPPCIVRSPSQEVRRQEGTIFRARAGPRCQRIPLVAMVTGGRVGGYTKEELLIKGVSPQVLSVNSSNSGQFIFEGRDFFSPASLRRGWVCVGDGVILHLKDGRVGVNELWSSFSVSPGIDPSLVSKEWFSNHYKWIVWKLASLEVTFPDQWAGRCLTVDWCLMQLKYRYDVEIDSAKRSIIHRICEGDDTPTRLMVLCVSHVTSPDEGGGNYSIQLTDGWYCLAAKLDTPLSSFVTRKLIKVGVKLVIWGAELLGDPTHGHPLEVWKCKSLSLNANSVRRVHWSTRLGLMPRPHLSFPLSAVIPGGGVVPAIKVIIARQYPVLYVEKSEGGGRVFRRQKEEERVVREWEELRQKKMELIYSQVEKKFQSELDGRGEEGGHRRRSGRLTSRSIKQLQDGQEIFTQLQLVSDPDSFMEMLTPTQLTLLESYRVAMATKRQEEFQLRLKKAIEENNELPPTRNVSTLLRLLLVQYGPRPSNTISMLSAWNVASEMRERLKEGTPLKITAVMASTNYHEGKLQLSSVKSTRYKPLPKLHPQMINYIPRKCTSLCTFSSSSSLYSEVDTVGLVVTSVLSQLGERNIDVIYLTDADQCILLIKVWEGLKGAGIEGVVIPGCLVAISNLRYSGKVGSTPPTCHVTDRTVFTQHPVEGHLVEEMRKLEQNLPTDRSLLLESLCDTISEIIT